MMTAIESQATYYGRLVAELRAIAARQSKYAECEHVVALREAEKKQAADDALIIARAAAELARITGVKK